MQDFAERQRIQPHAQHGKRQNREYHFFAHGDIGQFGNMRVGDCAEDHALVHPQRVGRAEDQRGCGGKGIPEIRFHRAEYHHEFADETAGAGQSDVGHREQHEECGEHRHGVGHTAVIGDVARVHPVIQHADAQEQRAGNEAVRDHLQQRAFHAVIVEDEQAQRDETHVRDRRIRHQLLHVGLGQRHQADVHHRDQRQRDHHAGQMMAGIRHDRYRETQKSVSAHLQHDRRQDHRTAGRRFDVRIRQPGMHRDHRHLHREGEEERDEDQDLRGHRDRDLVEIEYLEAAAGLVVEIDQRHQHQQRTEQGVEEELDRRIHAIRAAPHADDQEHRDQHRFPEHIEQDRIQRGEHADHDAGHDQE